MKRVRFRRSFILIVMATVGILHWPPAASGQSGGFTITPQVKRGDPSPDGGHFLGCDDCEGRINGSHAFNNRGDVALAADTEGACFDGRFLVLSGDRSVLLADFCHATVFGKLGLLGLLNINNSGQVAIQTGVTVEDRLLVTLLLYSNGTLTKIVQEGDTSPIGGNLQGMRVRRACYQ